MKQKIPTLACGEEIISVAYLCHCRVSIRSQTDDFLPTSANVLRGGRIALLGNQGSSENDVLASDLAVEADLYEPSWT